MALTGTAAAQGANGVITSYVDLYAGPDIGYPPVAELPAGTPVDIQGCLEGWTWCDVITMGTRGWVAGTFVQYTYENQPVIVADYGPRIGIPIVAFSIGVYWDHYYRDRPFYRDRDRWYDRHIESRPPPRPPGWRGDDRDRDRGRDRPPPTPDARQAPPPPHQPAAPAARPVPSAGYRAQPERAPEHQPPENRPSSPAYRPPPGGNRPPTPEETHRQPAPSPAAHPAPPPAQRPAQEHRPAQGESHGGQKPAPRPEPKKQDDNGH
ncbi:SH3 domain-containing protein [Dyella sp. EPa41]|uniref:SH3 domain-containing protein n=1 Tax=Dyella sp. EPa41 TaxID=1561194 RepID=UPI0019168AE2|nr:SH3 domain-containing protein [Dyella sp. EPa41]